MAWCGMIGRGEVCDMTIKTCDIGRETRHLRMYYLDIYYFSSLLVTFFSLVPVAAVPRFLAQSLVIMGHVC